MKKYCVVLLSLLLALFLLSCDSDNNEAESSGESRDQFVRADGKVYYVGEGFDVYEPEDAPLPEKEIVSEEYCCGFHIRYYDELSSAELNAYFSAASDAGYQVLKDTNGALLFNENNYVEVYYREYGTKDEVLTSVTCYGKKESYSGMMSPDDAITVIGRGVSSLTPVDITPREVFQEYGFQFFIQPYKCSSYSGLKNIGSSIFFISEGKSNEIWYRQGNSYVIADADSDGKVELWTIEPGPTSGLYTLGIDGYVDGALKYTTIVNLAHGTYTMSENEGKLCFAEEGGVKYGILLNKHTGEVLVETEDDSIIQQWGSGGAIYGNGDYGVESQYDFAGKTYVWEKEGFGGDFTITLDEDGKYTYYVGYLSSYIGMGKWKVEDGVLTMTENTGYDLVFRFSVKDGELVYIKEGSSEFMYVTVGDGDRFVPRIAEDTGE